MPRSNRPRRALLAALALALLAAGLAWAAHSAARGLSAGRASDIYRRWVEAQYTAAGINPYPLALTALRRAHGPLGGGREKPRIYAVPRHAEADEAGQSDEAVAMLRALGPPEAVYPPSADLLLSLTIAPLPPAWVQGAWLAVNVAALLGLTVLLTRLVSPAGGAPSWLLAAGVLALVLLWAPTQQTLVAGQFSLAVAACLLLGCACLHTHELAAGALFGLALVKPSIALPFLLLPLVRGRWKALAVAAGLHLGATCVLAARCGVTPWSLLGQWVGVTGYFTQGQYTFQEVIGRLGVADTPAGMALVLALVLAVTAWCWWHRGGQPEGDGPMIDLLCVVSVLWTYHGPYDFVILLPPLLRRIVGAGAAASPPAAAWALASFACLSLATEPSVYSDEAHLALRLVRHAARAVLLAWFAAALLEVRRAGRGRRPPVPSPAPRPLGVAAA